MQKNSAEEKLDEDVRNFIQMFSQKFKKILRRLMIHDGKKKEGWEWVTLTILLFT